MRSAMRLRRDACEAPKPRSPSRSEPVSGLEGDVAERRPVLEEAAARRRLVARKGPDDGVGQILADDVESETPVRELEREPCVEPRIARLAGERIDREDG